MSHAGLTYRDAGVDLDAAAAVKERLGRLVETTRTPAVRAAFGSFGGRFSIDEAAELVASADGVGTKLKIAFLTGRHDTVGADLVNHCVDDILTEGAVPLIFMDYFACGTLDPEVTVEVVSGVAAACRENGCALLGGETAEMPDFYPAGEYDLAGFVVGRIVFESVARRDVRTGDRLIALASTGLHTNGYSFARHLLFDRLRLDVDDPWPETGETVGDVLLRTHRSYLPGVRGPCADGRIQALAHVTGGGIPGNLGRILPDCLDAAVDSGSWEPPVPFRYMADRSGATPLEMYRTFNMGIGMIAVVRPDDVAAVLSHVRASGVESWVCGELVDGKGEVLLEAID